MGVAGMEGRRCVGEGGRVEEVGGGSIGNMSKEKTSFRVSKLEHKLPCAPPPKSEGPEAERLFLP